MEDITGRLDRLERDGFLLIESALSSQETEVLR